MRVDVQRAASVAFSAAFALTGFLATAPSVRADDVYVSASASGDSASGTANKPYKTIGAALAAHHAPGTTIHVGPGIYPEQVVLPASGSPDSDVYLLAEPAPGQPVVIEGADNYSNTGAWALETGTVWRASGFAAKPGQVLVDGARLVPDTLAGASLPSGHWSFADSALFVNLGGDSPGTHDTWVSTRPFGVSATGKSWIAILGFTIRRQGSRGINLTDGTTDVEVTQNDVSFAAGYGILANAGARIHLASNHVSSCGDHGMALTNGTASSLVEKNESNANARPNERAANGIFLENATQNVVRWNRLHDNQDTGLQMDPGTVNNQSIQNASWNNGDHGYDHLGATGNHHVGDVAFGNYKDGFSFEGGASGNSVENSIAVENGLTTNEFDLWVDSTSAVGFQSNDNIFWNSTSQEPVKYVKTLYDSLSGYQAASGQDSRTLQANPMFVNGPGGDFHVMAGSPAIDCANSGVTGWLGVDPDGLPPIDDPSVGNTGLGPVAYADRGCSEFLAQATSVPLPPDSGWAPGVFPNPLRGAGALAFSTPRPGAVRAFVVDASGRVVRRLLDRRAVEAGRHVVRLDTRGGDPLTAGVYFYRIETEDGATSGRFVVAR